jgi:hypothetical protein
VDSPARQGVALPANGTTTGVDQVHTGREVIISATVLAVDFIAIMLGSWKLEWVGLALTAGWISYLVWY